MNSHIIHIISAQTYHLTPNLLKNIIQKVPFNHFFVVIAEKNQKVDWAIYSKLFKELECKNYFLSTSLEDVKEIGGINPNSFIILHGDSYKWMLYFYFCKYKNVHWVCWGTGTKINKSIKSILSSFLKKIIYKKFRSIISLTEIDAIELKKVFGVTETCTIPYLGSIDNMGQFNKENLKRNINKLENVIYIGNNSSCLSTYNEVVHKIKKFAPFIEVRCMLNYNLVKNTIYKKLDEDGLTFFGSKFKMNTKFYELKDYPDYMNNCDIYICNADRQTGLAAIYMTLTLGKKLFLTGNNYSFIKEMGCHIYEVNDIDEMSKDEFISPLSLKIKERNFELIMLYLNEDKIIRKWNDFFTRYLIDG
jgi:hypothetical protein